jgi:hypothetical protein
MTKKPKHIRGLISELARAYGVTHTCVSYILAGKTDTARAAEIRLAAQMYKRTYVREAKKRAKSIVGEIFKEKGAAK